MFITYPKLIWKWFKFLPQRHLFFPNFDNFSWVSKTQYFIFFFDNPSLFNFLIASFAESSVPSSQPEWTTLPFRTSIAAIAAHPNSLAIRGALSGFLKSRLPIITLSAPHFTASRTDSALLSPPPYCMNIPRDAISSSTFKWHGCPSFAPSRSTMCMWRQPASRKLYAASSGVVS